MPQVQRKASETPPPTPNDRSPTRINYITIPYNNIYAEDLAQTHAGFGFVASVSLSPCEPCLADAAGPHGEDIIFLTPSNGIEFLILLPLPPRFYVVLGIKFKGVLNKLNKHSSN